MSKNFTDLDFQKIVSSIIANQLACDYNAITSHTTFYKHNLKKYVNMANKELMKSHKEYIELEAPECEVQSDALYNANFDMVKEISKLGLHRAGEITFLVKALAENPKSILGIATKILKPK